MAVASRAANAAGSHDATPSFSSSNSWPRPFNYDIAEDRIEKRGDITGVLSRPIYQQAMTRRLHGHYILCITPP